MKAIVCICALALLVEAVVCLPYAVADDDLNSISKRVADLLDPEEKRATTICPMDCFSCFKFIRGMMPDPCVKGCQTRHLVSDASYGYDRRMWNRCAQYLQRPLAR